MELKCFFFHFFILSPKRQQGRLQGVNANAGRAFQPLSLRLTSAANLDFTFKAAFIFNYNE